jgi:hypothetical protein
VPPLICKQNQNNWKFYQIFMFTKDLEWGTPGIQCSAPALAVGPHSRNSHILNPYLTHKHLVEIC